MSPCIHLFVLIFLSFSFAVTHSPNFVQNFDVSANGDGPNGYAFNPKGLAMDASGNIFFTDSNSIRMSNSSGVLTVSGPNTVPQGIFNGTSGIAVDSLGNLVVADSLNNAIKKIDSNGRVTRIGTTGNTLVTQVNGMVSTFATGFSQAQNIAFDSHSNLYVGDYNNNLVKKILPNGAVVPLASITYPLGMAVDGSGNVYVGSQTTSNVYKVSPGGSVGVLAGSGTANFADGTGASASFFHPYVGAVDGSGNVFVSDYGNSRIRKITAAGVVTTLAGSTNYGGTSTDGQGTSASFNVPLNLAMDSLGNLFVIEIGDCKIRKVSTSGYVSTIAGTGSCYSTVDGQGTSAAFSNPGGITVDGTGNIYVSDYSRIRMINSSNYVSTFAGLAYTGLVDGDLAIARFYDPVGLAFDPNTGNLFVSDCYNSAIRKITFPSMINTPALPLKSPTGVAMDLSGKIFIADQKNHMIKFIDTTGAVNVLAGSGNASYADGNGIFASFNSPYGVALDLYGNVIVADTGNNMIRNVTRAGSVTTIAGNGTAGWVDGQGTNSLLSSPMGLSVDGSNRVFISDSLNNCIRVINSTGYVNTVFFGRGSNLALTAPQGILVAPNGDLFIADSGNKRIRTTPASSLIGRI